MSNLALSVGCLGPCCRHGTCQSVRSAFVIGKLAPYTPAQTSKQFPSVSSATASSVRRCSGIGAANGDSEASPAEAMTTEEACSVLEVSKNAGFEEVLQAKKRLAGTQPADSHKLREIEAAYDVLLMASMKRRLGGEVSTNVRFADVAKSRPPQAKPTPQSLLGLVTVQRPDSAALAQQSVIFAALAAAALLPGLSEPQGSMRGSVPALQIGLAGLASFYFLRNGRRVPNGRAASLALAGAALGALVGGALNAWLQVDIVPVAGISSSAVFVSEFIIVSLWASCTFLS